MTKSSKTDIFPTTIALLNIASAKRNTIIEPLILQLIILIESIYNIY